MRPRRDPSCAEALEGVAVSAKMDSAQGGAPTHPPQGPMNDGTRRGQAGVKKNILKGASHEAPGKWQAYTLALSKAVLAGNKAEARRLALLFTR